MKNKKLTAEELAEEVRKWSIEPEEIDIDKGVVLGKGTYGTVYKGTLRGLPVAVKRMHSQIKKEHLMDFMHECATMSRVLHPNILLFMKICTQPHNLMMITELMPGGCLNDLLKNHPDLTYYERMLLARDIALGMNELHSCGFIHRDLKPQNVLVDKQNKLKVCDFGLSIHRDLVDDSGAKGSPIYMAPECLRGSHYTEKCDVYSYGLILNIMWNREKLFPEISSLSVLKQKICNEGLRPPIKNDVPNSLKSLMQECWDANDELRPSFQKILDDYLPNVLIDCAIQDKVLALSSYLNIPNPKSSPSFTYLKNLVSLEDGKLNITKFGDILQWFGPMIKDHEGWSIMEEIEALLEKPYFHQTATKETCKKFNIVGTECEEVLSNLPIGSYLFRFSNIPGFYGLSFRDQNGKVCHLRIEFNNLEGNFIFDNQSYSSLDSFLKNVSDPLNLKNPVSKHEDENIGGYQNKAYMTSISKK